jgi:hypothetical protein
MTQQKKKGRKKLPFLEKLRKLPPSPHCKDPRQLDLETYLQRQAFDKLDAAIAKLHNAQDDDGERVWVDQHEVETW